MQLVAFWFLMLSLMVGWTVMYHHLAVLKRWRRGAAVSLAILIVGALPLAVIRGEDYLEHRALQAAFEEVQRDFTYTYPNGKITSTVKIHDAWVLSYTEENQPCTTLRLNGQWIEVTEFSGTEGQ